MKDFAEAQAEGDRYSRHFSSPNKQLDRGDLTDAWVAGYRQAMRDLGDQLGLPPAGGWKVKP